VIVLVAEAADAVVETFADNVTGGVFAPPLRVTAGDSFSLGPTDGLGVRVEKPGSFLAVASRTMRRRTHPRPHSTLQEQRAKGRKQRIRRINGFIILLLINNMTLNK